ncbi:MAG: aldehyde dehydrogenase family protein [Solirubrobacteraceae bacterium]|nr:aldehyde dehydrogenase family protein [Solirubrobacteraceae bacterium]
MTHVVQSLIGGRWVVDEAAERSLDRNPARWSEVLAEVPRSGGALVDSAITAAIAARDGWARTSPLARGKLLLRVAAVIDERREDLARLMTAEQGKPLAEARGEVARVIDFCEWMSGQGGHMTGITAPSEAGLVALTTLEPLGVVGLLTPWNFPLNIPNWKIASALLHGNTAVLKASDLTARCAEELVRCYQDAGLPDGVLNFVTGSGSVVGTAIVEHPEVAAVSFTGSTAVGLEIAQRLAARGAKAQCEMGGSNPVVVCDDADLALAVDHIVAAAYGTSGQRCTAARRIIAVPAVRDELIERLEAARRDLTVGPGERDGVDVGPLCDPAGLEEVLASVARAEAEGCEVRGGERLDGGELADGLFMAPALVTGVLPGMQLAHEEVFGPVLAVQDAADYDHAVELANATTYGLSGAVFTRDLGRAVDFARRIGTGMVHVNKGPTGGESHLPFGGARHSSLGPKEMGAAREFFTQSKTVYLDARLS